MSREKDQKVTHMLLISKVFEIFVGTSGISHFLKQLPPLSIFTLLKQSLIKLLNYT